MAQFRVVSVPPTSGAVDEFTHMRPDARIINLETSITCSEDYARKGINYRMSPENADCLKAAAVDCCVLGNNHVLDWRRGGLLENLATLERLHIKSDATEEDSADNLFHEQIPNIGLYQIQWKAGNP